jgi:hypothetical protein
MPRYAGHFDLHNSAADVDLRHNHAKLMNTIETIENVFWGKEEYPSYLVSTCHALRKKDLDLFEVEDYRILIGQNIGLKILIPRAIEILKENIFAEGDMFEGDLLKSVLSSDKEYWNMHWEQKDQMIALFEYNINNLQNSAAFLAVDKLMIEKFEKFKS